MKSQLEYETNDIILDEIFKVKRSSGQFTLLRETKISSGKNEGKTKWVTCGYYGSIVSALKGYVRHSVDTCDSITKIITKVDELCEKMGTKR